MLLSGRSLFNKSYLGTAGEVSVNRWQFHTYTMSANVLALRAHGSCISSRFFLFHYHPVVVFEVKGIGGMPVCVPLSWES